MCLTRFVISTIMLELMRSRISSNDVTRLRRSWKAPNKQASLPLTWSMCLSSRHGWKHFAHFVISTITLEIKARVDETKAPDDDGELDCTDVNWYWTWEKQKQISQTERQTNETFEMQRKTKHTKWQQTTYRGNRQNKEKQSNSKISLESKQ